MKILMLSWEYPPKNVGGLSNHVYYLSKALEKLGNEVHVVTCFEGESPLESIDSGVFVHRVIPYNINTSDFTKWVMHLNFSIIEEVVKLIGKQGKFDVIHAHDWLTSYAAKTLKNSFNIPMVCTIHATEHGRNGGIRTELQSYISSAEWMLTYEAWKIVACSNYMEEEINQVLSAPLDKINIIPNGVDAEDFELDFDDLEFRRNYALDNEKIVFFIGRHVYEKGVQILIDAAPDIINSYKDIKFVIAGKGDMTEELKEKVKYFGLENKVLFTGYMDDETKKKMYKTADAAVFPSLYEPFGIVALEAMAAGCPVVASDIGGLKEVIEHKTNGMKIITGSKDSLKENLLELLRREDLRKHLKEKGIETVLEKYSWDKIAEATVKMYEKVKEEAKGTEWEVSIEKVKKKGTGTTRRKKTEVIKAVDNLGADEVKITEEITVKPKRTRKKANS